jgi:hypothetical protein
LPARCILYSLHLSLSSHHFYVTPKRRNKSKKEKEINENGETQKSKWQIWCICEVKLIDTPQHERLQTTRKDPLNVSKSRKGITKSEQLGNA